MTKLPKVRTENILEQNLKNETLIYDLRNNKAFNLNAVSTIIYKACDGETTIDELKRKHTFTDHLIYLTLDELKRNDLLDDENYLSPLAGMNRREAIRKAGLTSLTALPLIAGLGAPSAVRAASGGCQTNVCYPSGLALCNACPFTVNFTFYNSQDGSFTTQGVTSNDSCTSGRYTVRDARVNSIP